MISDLFPKRQVIPTNISDMCEGLEKVISIINSAKTFEHLNVAERMLNNLAKTWKLNSKHYHNPIYVALKDKIANAKLPFIREDLINMSEFIQ